MRMRIAAFVMGSLVACGANAATWYGFTMARNNQAMYFFDADSIVKHTGVVTIWVKYIKWEGAPDSDGSYSTAMRTAYSCTKRTMQSVTTVIYDKDQNHMRTSSGPPSNPVDVVPGSIAEEIIKAVCAPGFPNPKADEYVRVGNNDIYSAARRILDSINDPAPK